MTLQEAKLIADRFAKTEKAGSYTKSDFQQAINLLERTNRGNKTQKAWDRLDRRLAACRNAVRAVA